MLQEKLWYLPRFSKYCCFGLPIHGIQKNTTEGHSKVTHATIYNTEQGAKKFKEFPQHSCPISHQLESNDHSIN